MTLSSAFIPLPAALLWIASRDVRAIDRASALSGELAVGAAILDLEEAGIRELSADPGTGQPIEVLKRGAGPLLALQQALESGRIVASGDNGSGQMIEVPVSEWANLRVGLKDEASREGATWRQLVVPTGKLFEVFPSSSSAEASPVKAANAAQISLPIKKSPGRPARLLVNMERDLARHIASNDAPLNRNEALAFLSANYKASISTFNSALRSVGLGKKANSIEKSAKNSAKQ